MQKYTYFIGTDISANSFTCCCITAPDKPVFLTENLPNTLDGFQQLNKLLKTHRIRISTAIICLEATGVYAEKFCYFFASKGLRVSVVDPKRVKYATQDSPRKNDTLDAHRIAEYASRFTDKLIRWLPNSEILEQIKVLLATREHLVQQKTANENALKTLQRKYYQTALANKVYRENITQFKKNIKAIDKELSRLIDKDDSLKQFITLATSVPGVGTLLAANLLVLTKGFIEPLNYKKLAAYSGICPFEKQSGTSLNKIPRSRRYGPAKIRKLLYLASLSVKTHNQEFKKYFYRKRQEGKPNKLILNNIANRVLKITCAVINSKTAFIENYKSINQNLLKSA